MKKIILFIGLMLISYNLTSAQGDSGLTLKRFEYEGFASVCISYPMGIGFNMTHGVRYTQSRFFIGGSVGLDYDFDNFPSVYMLAGVHPRYYFADTEKLDAHVSCEIGATYLHRSRSDIWGLYVKPGIGIGVKLKSGYIFDISLSVRPIFNFGVDKGVILSPDLSIGIRF